MFAIVNLSQAEDLEKNIVKIKLDISKISEERWRAALSRNQNEVIKVRVKAAEKTLENVGTLAKYVANFSTPLARQITKREDEARRTFEEVRRTTNSKIFQEWVKDQLIPSTRFAERLGHLAASASKPQGTSEDFHKWSRR